MDNELRKNVRLRWFESLFELSHYEFQKKVWIEAEIENHVSDYSEAICKYFDDLDLSNGLLKFRDEGFITEIEAEIFIDFHNKLEDLVNDPEKNNFSDIMILQDSKWINLTNLAKDKWSKLKENLIQEEEINYISELEKKHKQFL